MINNQKFRNSSIELYRIIATLAVLIVHFNGWFIGMPEKLDILNPSSFRIGQALIESATCICVNMFLLISGYFGIHLKWSSILKISLLLLFIFVPFYLIQSVVEGSYNTRELISKLFVLSRAGFFVQCYLLLMFLSPVFNAFVEKEGKRILLWTLAFILIEFWFDNIKQLDCLAFGGGYSIMHFVLVYMVARCLALYKEDLLKIKKVYWIIGYIICTVFIFLLYFIGVKWTFAYSNPLVLLSAICTFMPFLYHTYYNRVINWIASSTFAVYIIHITSPLRELLVNIENQLLIKNSYGIYLIGSVGVIMMTFIFSIIYDKLCQLFIKPIISKLNSFTVGNYEYQ